ncbi:MAG: hypothetical protein CAPSK01_004530 [Candidatus Accumulibacter vicinus]|uniref:Uncharacterized protein n=1 Tax=Candidatus Accumulibacter vicinus TaxID=2954382 RepID=A0A084XUL7_9PROT|nr:MAG: hypothetical protein CAPSK01_004530 [Candidatus Accumulibacter vicinus]
MNGDLGVVVPVVDALVPPAFQSNAVGVGFCSLLIRQPSRHHGARFGIAVHVEQDHLLARHRRCSYRLPRA